MMDYDKATDHEINLQVAKYFHDKGWLERHGHLEKMIPDYCDNPSKLVLMIIEYYKISVINCGDYWSAESCINKTTTQVKVHNENLYRAIALCFLKMNEEK